ncbi:hypothetical protein KO507_19745 [Gilvimarinus agarilyticus]|uniref:Uncharacterized protein n=1 Tax=Reichenbachiella agariperforans TaxID=156994 RepID=A0A1M6MYQ0_REIAG|nr:MULTISPECIES: hypothetical protein [Reichenbachiella]MBU2888009.1 hypothetical protein [Gilvimarinus agarilyticus]MBU2915640.1 hypothetical protein [Reichenbachiella agariperforans]RJE72084.1 hypothetical protein BGP76_08405 [Reichenbachiella sp. MSK19-1]SHJ88585.1 hypothetical protein SAMN04488028_10213 [Reichenbachiella agariperforans]
MKKLITIFTAVLITSFAHASSTDKNEKEKSEKTTAEYNPDDLKGSVVKPRKNTEISTSATNVPQKETVADPDSSYYSVNKFNYLFYYVYKLKYLTDEESGATLGIEP